MILNPAYKAPCQEVGYFEDVWNNFNPERTQSRSRSERCPLA